MARRILPFVALVVVVIAVIAAFVLWPRGTTEVTAEDALTDFRERGSVPATEPPADAVVPAPGVYTFAAQGQEEVKLGPLPAQTRPLGETVTAVVVDAGDGCFDWTLNLFAEHTEDTRYCADGSNLQLSSHTKHQKIGALSPTATMSCDPSVIRGAGTDPLDLRCTLTLSGGPASITASVSGTATARAPESVTVGERSVEATPVTVAFEVTGDLTGSWTEETWWGPANLPVRINRTLDLKGLATFSEKTELTLTSLEPAS